MKKRDVLHNPELARVFISIVKGINYPQRIAKNLNKTPATIVDQVQKLKREGLITSKKEKLLNKTRYSVNWDKIEEIFIKLYNAKLQATLKELKYGNFPINYKTLCGYLLLWGLSEKVLSKDLKLDPIKKFNLCIKNLFKQGTLIDMLTFYLQWLPKYDKTLTLNQGLSLFFMSCSQFINKRSFEWDREKKNVNKIYKKYEDLIIFMSSCAIIHESFPLDYYFNFYKSKGKYSDFF